MCIDNYTFSTAGMNKLKIVSHKNFVNTKIHPPYLNIHISSAALLYVTSLSKRHWNSFIAPTRAIDRNRGSSVGIMSRLRVRWLMNRGSIPFSRSRPGHPASNSMGGRIFLGVTAHVTWSWELTPSNAEVRNKCSYASTPPYALKAWPFTFIFTTPLQIARYFLITSKCSNPHSFAQSFTLKRSYTNSYINGQTSLSLIICSDFTSVALIRASWLKVEW